MTRVHELTDLRPGDIGFGPLRGPARTVAEIGQWMLKDSSRWHHVFVVTDAGTGEPGEYMHPMGVEAMPRGARWWSLAQRWTPEYVYIRLPYESGVGWSVGNRVAAKAKELIGTPYSFLDYLALALRGRGLDTFGPGAWVRRRVTDSGHMICSQLADQALARAGVQVFRDGRLSQDVTPGALFYGLLAIGGTPIFPDEPLV